MIHERVTGTLHGDLEMAHMDLLTDPDRRPWFGTDSHYRRVARRWNLWPETLEAYLDYQRQRAWIDAFVKGWL